LAQKIKTSRVFFILVFIVLFSSCTNPSSPEIKPVWLDAFLKEREAKHITPQEIWKYEWNTKTVYFVLSQCCDQLNLLLDKNGKVLCSPSGGFSGTGDGKCPSFWNEKKNGKLIWEYED
jgi:ABC-type Fe3+-hydroxamate transport system substrate-binding protein